MSKALQFIALIVAVLLPGLAVAQSAEDVTVETSLPDEAAVAEEAPMETESAYQINEIEWAGQTYVAKKKTLAFDAVGDFLHKKFEALYDRLQQEGVEITGPATGLIWDWNEEAGEATLAAAVPVPEGTAALDEYEVIQIPPGKAVVTDHIGPYDESMAAAMQALDTYVQENGLTAPQVIIEEYLTDPEQEEDASKMHTRITYVLSE